MISQKRYTLAVAASLWIALKCGASPTLTATNPFAFQRGSESPIRFSGQRLNDPSIRLLSYTEGILLSEWKSEKPQQAEAVLHVAEDVSVGLHAIRLVSDRGISKLRTIYVGALPRVDETEPNNNEQQCQQLSGECTVAGLCQVRDEDWYELNVPEGWQRLSAEIHGLRLGNQLFDPLIEVFGPDGQRVVRCDDTPLSRQDPFVTIATPTAGKYRFVIRDAMYRGAGNYWYLLHVGQFPRPSFAVPAGATAGSEVNITWHNRDQATFSEHLMLPTNAQGSIDLLPQDAFGIAPSPVPFEIESHPLKQETEPNNNPGQANPIEWPTVIQGRLESPGDVDTYKFSAKKGVRMRFRARTRKAIRSDVDPVVTVLNAKGGYLASNDDSGGPDSLLDYTIPEDAEYHVSVRDFLRRGDPSYWYHLSVARPTPRLTLRLPERRRNDSITLSVPQGNRMAVLVRAQRTGLGGEVTLNLENLPEGVSFEAPALPADRAQIPLLVSCQPDTEPTAVLSPLTGVCVQGEQSVAGKLAQRQLLVAGRNNRDMWGFDSERLAVAVTKPAPFRLDLLPPKAPIVQRGVMQLRVQATRDPGFEAAITVQALYMPPGLSAKGRVNIPAKEHAIDFALNANGKARLGTPSLILLGRAVHDGVNVEVATALVPLTIATPYVALKPANVSLTRGGEVDMTIGLTVNTPFEGSGTAELLGLPPGVSSDPVNFSAEQNELVFRLQANQDARIGRKGGIVCRAVITQYEEPITHMLGVGQVRVDPAPTAVASTP